MSAYPATPHHDAAASRIEIEVDGGGLARILVADDGAGLTPEELSLAVERHATSKLALGDDGTLDLLNIATMGFRGEALPSIGSVARLSISSRAKGQKDAHAILVEGGRYRVAVLRRRPSRHRG